MKLAIAGVEYDYQTALQKALLSDLYDLSLAAKIGPRSINQALIRMGDAETLDELLVINEEASVLLGLSGLVFLCKRHAGEKVTWDESQVAFSDLAWVTEDGELDDEPDPTQAAEAEAPSGKDSEPEKSVSKPPAKKAKTSRATSSPAS